jgi:undecaprenyl-diphosphatase
VEPSFDVRLLRRLAGPPDSRRAGTARTLTPLADGLAPWLAATPALVLSGERGRRAVAAGWESIGVAALIADLVARSVRRARPAGGALRHRIPAGHEPSSSSFPSAHTSSAVAFVTAVVARMPQARPVLVPLAVLVAWTRPAGGRHYPSDVLAGAAIGVAAATVTRRHFAVERPARIRPPGGSR